MWEREEEFRKFTKIPVDTGKFSFLPSIFSRRKSIQTHRFSHDSLIFSQAHDGLNIFTTLISFPAELSFTYQF